MVNGFDAGRGSQRLDSPDVQPLAFDAGGERPKEVQEKGVGRADVGDSSQVIHHSFHLDPDFRRERLQAAE